MYQLFNRLFGYCQSFTYSYILFSRNQARFITHLHWSKLKKTLQSLSLLLLLNVTEIWLEKPDLCMPRILPPPPHNTYSLPRMISEVARSHGIAPPIVRGFQDRRQISSQPKLLSHERGDLPWECWVALTGSSVRCRFEHLLLNKHNYNEPTTPPSARFTCNQGLDPLVAGTYKTPV